MSKPPRCAVDTSVVLLEMHGDKAVRQVVSDLLGDRRKCASPFIRMEFLRTLVTVLIEFYFVLKEAKTVGDALNDWQSKKGFKPRQMAKIMESAAVWLGDHPTQQKQANLRRLGEYILRLIAQFDREYRSQLKDRTKCQLGQVKISDEPFSEDNLLDFYARFRNIQQGQPGCDLCLFCDEQVAKSERGGVSIEDSKDKHAGNKGFSKQMQGLEKELARERQEPRCFICERLGDTIISAHLTKGVALITGDHSFEAFGDVLGFEVLRVSRKSGVDS